MKGGDDPVRFLAYFIAALQTLQANLPSLPWVSSVSAQANNGRTTWQIGVTGEAAAESQLLPLLVCDERINVIEFGRKKHDLEEVFLNIVEGSKHVHA